jgi:hypothetical protein
MTSHEPTPAQDSMLVNALDFEETVEGAGLATGRRLRRKTALALVAHGLMIETVALLVDGDGWTKQPEREVPAFRLTPAGRRRAIAVRAARRAT